MEIIAQLGFIIGVGYAGELLARSLPIRLPAGVLGIVLVFAALSLRFIKPRHFGKTADFISAQMGFFFLPLSVSILQNYQAVSPVLFQIIAVCVISTLTTFAASYGAVRFLRVVTEKGGNFLSNHRHVRPRTLTPPPSQNYTDDRSREIRAAGIKPGAKAGRSSSSLREAFLEKAAGREEIPPVQSGEAQE
jgi:holin-like protein